jgi:hypothetical protein
MPLPDQPNTPLLIEESNTITGGIVANAEAHLIQPDQAAYLLNIKPQINGLRTKVDGLLPLGSAGAYHPFGLFGFEAPFYGLHDLVVVYGNHIYSTPGDGTFTERAAGLLVKNEPVMGTVGRSGGMTSLFLASCVPSPSNASLPYNAILALDRNYGWTQPSVSLTAIRARSLAWNQSRLWAFNCCHSNTGPDYLCWSKPLDGSNFDNGQTLQVESDTGDEGMAILPLRDSTPRMILFKRRSVYIFEFAWTTDGYLPTTANALDTTKSSLRPLTLESGLVGTRAAVWAPGNVTPNTNDAGDILYLSDEGIRSLKRSITDSEAGVGLPLSFRIQPYIDRINWAAAAVANALYHDGTAYFAVPLDGSAVNNFVIAYDTRRDAFWFSDWPIADWTKCTIGGHKKFYFLGGNAAVTETYSAGATSGYHLYENFNINSAVGLAGSPIDMDESTRAFTFPIEDGSASGLKYRKRWAWLDVTARAGTTTVSLAVSYKIDDDKDWTNLSTVVVSPVANYPYLDVQLPFTFQAYALTHNKVTLDLLRPGYKIQFRLRDNTSLAQLQIQQLTVAAYPMPVTFS